MTDETADPAHEPSATVVAADATPGADVIYLPDERQLRKKVTSGSEKRQRTQMVRFRVDDKERKALDAKVAASSFKSDGAYLMHLAKIDSGKESQHRRRGRPSVNAEALTKAIVAFNRAGTNQNQIARALNELALVAHEQSNVRLESQIMELAEAIRGLPLIFAEPVAAIMAALNDGGDDP